MNFPDYLADSIRQCGHGHTVIRTPAATTKCPICTRRRNTSTEPRRLDPEPWGAPFGATGYGEQRARESRQRGIEKSREVRKAS